jgi:hypothetical protein
MKSPALLLALLAAAAVAPAPAHAATECTGIVTSLPATLSTPGVWCLSADVGTAIASGNAIRLAANNTTLDCRGFRINGLAAGPGTNAVGIAVENKSNTIIRDCHVRGFHTGIRITTGDGGHLVEDNRIDGSTVRGIVVEGDHSLVRRNRVLDTGGGAAIVHGIWALGTIDLEDNTVEAVQAAPDDLGAGTAYGIRVQDGALAEVTGNRVRRVIGVGAGESIGVRIEQTPRAIVRANSIGLAAVGTSCGTTGIHAFENTFATVATPIVGCTDAGDNVDVTLEP